MEGGGVSKCKMGGFLVKCIISGKEESGRDSSVRTLLVL